MEHKITTQVIDEKWEQWMTCEFPNEVIATLVLQDSSYKMWWGDKVILSDRDGYIEERMAAKVEQKGKLVEVYCSDACAWDYDHEVNRTHLEALAQRWEAQEDQYLPIMQYFEAHVKGAMNEWAKRNADRVADLQMTTSDLDSRLSNLAQEVQDLQFQLNNHCDKVGELDEEMTALQKLYEGLHRLFFQHVKQRFHFSRRGEKNQPKERKE